MNPLRINNWIKYLYKLVGVPMLFTRWNGKKNKFKAQSLLYIKNLWLAKAIKSVDCNYWTSYIYLLIITNWKCPIELEKLISHQSPIRWRASWGSSIMHQNRTLDMAHFSCNFVAIFVILSKLDQYMKIEQLTSMPITTCKALCLYGL